jgi:para-aminobenzoate synthetase component I
LGIARNGINFSVNSLAGISLRVFYLYCVNTYSYRLNTDLSRISPVKVARQLMHHDALVFFDSSGNFTKNSKDIISIIAAGSPEIFRGNLHQSHDVDLLKKKLSDNYNSLIEERFPRGGLFGWVDYNGDFVFGVFHQMLVFCHASNEWFELGDLSQTMRDDDLVDANFTRFRSMTSHEEFVKKANRIKEYIAAGDIYQVNLTQQFVAEINTEGSLFSLYEILREISPAPMSSYLKMEGREALSSSPEMFLKINERSIETRPIKGTRPRFAESEKDLASINELQNSSKEIAELVMITDLLRNDFGKFCHFGSVKVDKMLQLETLEQLHHLVSTISGEVSEGVSTPEILEKCFPGGSITGAPKKRAMEIIDELEAVPRGLYCGAIGYMGFNEKSQFSVVIRTLVREKKQLHYHVGAGIVADSDPQFEYDETLLKAAGIRKAIHQWSSFVQNELN